MTWVSSHKDTWCQYSLWTDQAKRGLEQCWSSEPGKLLLSRKDCGLHRRDIQVVKPYKCGRQGPAGCLTNVFQIQRHKPVPLAYLREDLFQSDHTERPFHQGVIQESEI